MASYFKYIAFIACLMASAPSLPLLAKNALNSKEHTGPVPSHTHKSNLNAFIKLRGAIYHRSKKQPAKHRGIFIHAIETFTRLYAFKGRSGEYPFRGALDRFSDDYSGKFFEGNGGTDDELSDALRVLRRELVATREMIDLIRADFSCSEAVDLDKPAPVSDTFYDPNGEKEDLPCKEEVAHACTSLSRYFYGSKTLRTLKAIMWSKKTWFIVGVGVFSYLYVKSPLFTVLKYGATKKEKEGFKKLGGWTLFDKYNLRLPAPVESFKNTMSEFVDKVFDRKVTIAVIDAKTNKPVYDKVHLDHDGGVVPDTKHPDYKETILKLRTKQVSMHEFNAHLAAILQGVGNDAHALRDFIDAWRGGKLQQNWLGIPVGPKDSKKASAKTSSPPVVVSSKPDSKSSSDSDGRSFWQRYAPLWAWGKNAPSSALVTT